MGRVPVEPLVTVRITLMKKLIVLIEDRGTGARPRVPGPRAAEFRGRYAAAPTG
jgi:hypothetical protein